MTIQSLPFPFEPVQTLAICDQFDIGVIRHSETGERYLLKTLKNRLSNPLPVKMRLKRDLDFASSLDHPNIAKPLFSISENGIDAVAYHYCGGTPCVSFLEEKGRMLGPGTAIPIVVQLLGALEYLHTRGIIHCSAYPDVLFIDDQERFLLLDFGNSLFEDEAVTLPENRAVGSVPCISPEQSGFPGFKIDARSDLYCAGLLLYRMCAGRFPFALENGTLEEFLHRAMRSEAAPLADLPSTLNSILLKALKPTPSDRYQTASGFKHDLMAAFPVVAGAVSRPFTPGLRDAIIAVNRTRLFVGRAGEIDALKDGHARLLCGKNSSFCVSGASGIGKTELVREFYRTLPREVSRYLSSKCNCFTPMQPYSVLTHLTLDFITKIGMDGHKAQSGMADIAEKSLAEYSGIICKTVPEMRRFFKEVKPIDAVEPEKEADRTAHVLFTMVEAFCSYAPLVLFIDDLQWIDLVSLEIIVRLIKSQTRCMIMLSFRSAADPGSLAVHGRNLAACGVRKFIRLGTFSRNEIRDLAFSRFGEIADTTEFLELLETKTDCSPFAIAEAMRFLVNNSYMQTFRSRWALAVSSAGDLPERLDPFTLLLEKMRTLDHQERSWLEAASLTEGMFEVTLIEAITGIPSSVTGVITARLEETGILTPYKNNGFRFSHDHIQETIRNSIPEERVITLYEKFGETYEALATGEKRLLFLAAECFLKTDNLPKRIDVCHKAARYAAETTAHDVASRYFAKSLLMVSQCPALGIKPPVDETILKMEYGDVLMLTGRNEQALKMFKELLEKNDSVNENIALEMKYKIGYIYHFMGDFEKSVPYFIEALRTLQIRFPRKNILPIVLMFEILKQILFLPIHFIYKSKNIDPKDYLIARILNLLTYSLYFQDMPLSYYSHFKSLNLADRLSGCNEKIISYSSHGVGSYQAFFKKRAYKYLNKSIAISQHISRKDSFGFAQYMNGVVNYYNGFWNNSLNFLHAAINSYKLIGDISNLPQCTEHIWKIYLMRGDFKNTKDYLNQTIELCKIVTEKHFLAASIAELYFLKTITTQEEDKNLKLEIQKCQTIVTSLLSHSEVNISLIKTDILQNRLIPAIDKTDALLSKLKGKVFNQEYYVSVYALHCEIILKLLYNKKHKSQSFKLPHRSQGFAASLVTHWFSCLSFPAYWGSLYRNLAWFCTIKNHHRLADHFFHKAMRKHHEMEMRYEEARSIRDYALFLEERNQPGLARDHFNQAYLLFEKCGAALETSRIEDKVDREHAAPEAPVETSTSSFDTADQIRVDVLYDASLQLAQSDTVEALLRQTVHSLIKATGAQFGMLHLDGDEFHEPKELVLNFEDNEIPLEEVAFAPDLVDRTRKERQIVIARANPKEERADSTRAGKGGSALCVPLMRGEKYFGCVYLTNTLVSGLFSETSSKAAQIIAGQASFLIENMYLMEEYKRLNARLEHKVKEQMSDIRDKIEILSESNLKLIESEWMKDLLSGSIVHDLKNHLFSISSNNRALARFSRSNPAMEPIVNDTSWICASAANLCANILEISKMEEGRLTLQQRQVYFEELAAIAQKFGRNVLFDEKKITANVTMPKGDFAIMADPYLMERVIQNLYSNAAKYTNAGGNVIFSFEETGGENILTFASSGPVIPDDQKTIIFEKYSRVDGKQSQYSKGLGLFFCKMVMAAHGGRIWLDTDEQGNYFRLGFKRL